MFRSESTLISVGLVFVIFIAAAEGLECFICYGEDSLDEYEATEQGVEGSSSCRYGNAPHISLTKTCPVTRDAYGKVLQPLCVTMYYTVTSLELKRDLKMTLRECVAVERTPGTGYGVPQKVVNCFQNTHKELLGQGVKGFAKEGLQVTDDTVFDFCYCNHDHCNSAEGNEARMKLTILGVIATTTIRWLAY